ncbi:MAG TPA: ATP-binding protein [Candidatus Binatia bacterium]|nr:ATP-binding protein [Candidatus Binatia bacterium]
MTDSPSPLLGYGVSVVTVVAALSLNLLSWPLVQGTPSSLFFAAVMVSSWYGGLGPGLLATVLSAIALDYFFITPVHSLSLDWSAIVRLSVFLLVALLTSYLTAARKRAEEALRIAHGQLEKRVEERTIELAQANESLRAEILERKRAENELWRLQREMGRVERLAALGRITGTIAHELGTPLNSVLGYTQLLAQEELSEGARRRLTIIATQVQRMGDIIQHYLSRTRGSSRKDQIHINEMVRETLVLLNPIFQQHAVEVTAILAESLPLLRGDEASLQRVLINVLDNAVDATKERGLLKIATHASRSSETEGPGVIIEITDTGAGIPAELLPKIFDLFVTTKPSGKGTGLGLVVCQEIVKAHRGNIEINSRVGEGTCVRIFLPADERLGESALVEGAK